MSSSSRPTSPRPRGLRRWLMVGFGLAVGGAWGAASVLQERAVKEFHAVFIAVPGAVDIRRGDRERVVIEAPPETLTRIVTEVEDGILGLRLREPGWRLDRPIRVRITYRSLDAAEISGSADVTMDRLSADSFELIISGSSTVDVETIEAGVLTVSVSGSGELVLGNVVTDSLVVSVSGSGDVAANGRAEQQTVEVSGSGAVDTRNVRSRDARATVGGSGNVRLWVEERLDASISGSGDIAYRGEPEVFSRISGSGRLGPG